MKVSLVNKIGKSSQNSIPCLFCLYIRYYKLLDTIIRIVLSISVMSFGKSVDGWEGIAL